MNREADVQRLFELYDVEKEKLEKQVKLTFQKKRNKKEASELLHGIELMIKERKHALRMMGFQAEKLGIPIQTYQKPIQKQIDVLTLFQEIGKEVLGTHENL